MKKLVSIRKLPQTYYISTNLIALNGLIFFYSRTAKNHFYQSHYFSSSIKSLFYINNPASRTAKKNNLIMHKFQKSSINHPKSNRNCCWSRKYDWMAAFREFSFAEYKWKVLVVYLVFNLLISTVWTQNCCQILVPTKQKRIVFG